MPEKQLSSYWEVNTSMLPGGWYYYRLEVGKDVFVKKMRGRR